ncbi:LysM peptidoglycan-binding domain-containing protein [Bacteriovoracaceae bacterium]|nr:LysM peptidoglycan-binding domain-containing protein [Bacteriovoracaceae bacterium]
MKTYLTLRRHFFTFCLIFSGIIHQSQAVEIVGYRPIVVKKGDTVSEIVDGYRFSPIYGKNQWLERVLKLNRLDLDEAKNIKPGDVVVIPLETYVMNKDELDQKYVEKTDVDNDYVHQDEISKIKSGWSKERLNQEMSTRRNEFTLKAGYFNRELSHKETSTLVNQQTNFIGEISYKRNDLSGKEFSYSPVISAGVYSQANADFESDDNLVAEFLPSTYGTLGLEIGHKPNMISLTPYVTYETFSLLDYTDEDDYFVEEEQAFWTGLRLQKNFPVKFDQYFVAYNYNYNAEFNGQSQQLTVGTVLKNRYLFEIYGNQTELEINEKINHQNIGLTLGYQF